jgi:hypothetical protein
MKYYLQMIKNRTRILEIISDKISKIQPNRYNLCAIKNDIII